MISLIAAMGKNKSIGIDGDMPWHLPRDLSHFKKLTTGHTIVMGRKTYESIGKPLPKRKNVVLTRKQEGFSNEVQLIHHFHEVLNWNEKNPEKEIFVIGGGNVYKQALPFADRLYITKIDEVFAGDTFFPEFSTDEWKLQKKVKGKKDEKNPYDYYFLRYDRIKSSTGKM